MLSFKEGELMESLQSERVLVLGASDKPDRYSHKAMIMLQQHGHTPVLVHPRLECINGIPVHQSLSEVEDIDTLTMYVNAEISSGMKEEILNLGAKRVIFNPGTENPELKEALIGKGAEVEEACTLVLLSTSQF